MRAPAKNAVLSSLIAGQAAGVVMGVVAMAVFALVLGKAFLFPLQVMTGLFAGDSALGEVSLRTTLPGLLAHQLGPAFFWSMVFAACAVAGRDRFTLGQALLVGFAIGGISQIVDVYLLMPPFQEAVNGHNVWAENVPRFWDWAAHFAYGLSLGGIYVWCRDRLGVRFPD